MCCLKLCNNVQVPWDSFCFFILFLVFVLQLILIHLGFHLFNKLIISLQFVLFTLFFFFVNFTQFSVGNNLGAIVEYSPHYHTAARLGFKCCLQTLGLGQSWSKTRDSGLYSTVTLQSYLNYIIFWDTWFCKFCKMFKRHAYIRSRALDSWSQGC